MQVALIAVNRGGCD